MKQIIKRILGLPSRKSVISVVACLFLTLAVLSVNSALTTLFHYREIEGYDFDSIISNPSYDWVGPQAGERVQLGYLTDNNLQPLTQKQPQKLLVLLVFDRECGACRLAGDQSSYLRESLEKQGVGFGIISFSQRTTHARLSRYVDSFDSDASTYVWTKGASTIPLSIRKMVVPSYILVNRDGWVIKTFPGTDKNSAVREKMINQIIKEATMENLKPPMAGD
ncbi:MAG: hypothetical protein J5I65_09470 [Aridibacter famidurans]|nr:hypothetical protein [Aridibacter famidurans]